MIAIEQCLHGWKHRRLVQVGHIVGRLAASHLERIEGDLLLFGDQQRDLAARHATQFIEPVGIETKAKLTGGVLPGGEVQRHGVDQSAIKVKDQALESGKGHGAGLSLKKGSPF